MVRISLAFVLIMLGQGVLAQLAPHKYWVEFTDKFNSPYSLEEPSAFLSQRAIDRRINQSIGLDATDLPVNPQYIQQVLQTGDVQLMYPSKWFNAVAVYFADSTLLDDIAALPFVATVRSMPSYGRQEFPQLKPGRAAGFTKSQNEYGAAFHQIEMLNGHRLHEAGYTGNGMRIALMDGGYNSADQMEAFAPLIEAGRLLGTYDFVGTQENVFYSSSHGTRVWSTMASYWPDSIIGAAYSAEYLLFLTEDVGSEYQLEEVNWIAAAEMADSAGVDVLNTSLGYTLFDDPEQNYSYADMDGQTTWISRGANFAAQKGMLVVNSAGNSGSGSWFYISAPADADSVLAIGAILADSTVAGFSSRGPSVDGRVKPNVMAQGVATVMANTNNTMTAGNGTSFSSPIVAALAACLWQTQPKATNMQVFRAIEQSAHLYTQPNDSMGFGIPDFWKARTLLEQAVLSGTDNLFGQPMINAYPNPFKDEIQLLFQHEEGGLGELEVFDVMGRLVFVETLTLNPGRTLYSLSKAFSGMTAGNYVVRFRMGEISDSVKIQKVE